VFKAPAWVFDSTIYTRDIARIIQADHFITYAYVSDVVTVGNTLDEARNKISNTSQRYVSYLIKIGIVIHEGKTECGQIQNARTE